VLNVQRHDCFPKCKTKRGEPCEECKYGYPRDVWQEDAAAAVDAATLPEDQRLSPYVPLWLMAWGASMNIQFCTTAAFLSYIAKYVTKPEPYGVLPTNPPQKRMRSLARADQRLERKERQKKEDEELRFADGAIETFHR